VCCKHKRYGTARTQSGKEVAEFCYFNREIAQRLEKDSRAGLFQRYIVLGGGEDELGEGGWLSRLSLFGGAILPQKAQRGRESRLVGKLQRRKPENEW